MRFHPTVNGFWAIIETPAGSRAKYELDEEDVGSGDLYVPREVTRVSRIVQMPYPANYGFIPGATGDDREPLDAFVCSDDTGPLVPGSRVEAEVVAAVRIETKEGFADGKKAREDKLICVPTCLGVPVERLLLVDAVCEFLVAYKGQGVVRVIARYGETKAKRILLEAIQRQRGSFR